jgi:large subunit ribosomal protein L35
MKTKNKTHRGAKKRIKVTSTGKLMRRRAMSSHLLTKKSSKRKRKFRKDNVLNATDRARVRNLIGA